MTGDRGQAASVPGPGLVETAAAPPVERTPLPSGRSRVQRFVRGRVGITLAQLIILGLFLAAWEWLPSISALQHSSHVFDRFFISSPSKVVSRLDELLFGDAQAVTLKYIKHTVLAAVVGLLIGLVSGGILGLLVASWNWLAAVFRPFAVAMNAIPRIALIPIIVVMFGPTFKGSVIISVIVVFFIAFFNAYEGARSVGPALINNAKIMGAGGLQITWRIRGPYATAWTLASLPLSATFSVIAVVTGEVLTGYSGLGTLITTAASTVDATLTFAVVVLLTVIGLLTVGVAEVIRRRILHWWGRGE